MKFVGFSVDIDKNNVEELTKSLADMGIKVVGQTKTKLLVEASELDFINYNGLHQP